MKKYIITLSILWVFTLCVNAGVVTPERAARYAGKVMGMISLPDMEESPTQRVAGRDGVQDPGYYVFNNPDGGWVIIAADDRVTPVLGYSETGRFSLEDMPENVSWWMNGIAHVIDLVRDSDAEASEQAKMAWMVLDGKAAAPERERKTKQTANWSQETPYNDLCPIVAGEKKRSVTGCVATAMSIIMRYNSWPQKGIGTVGGYYTTTFRTRIPSYSIDSHVYDWSNMPLTNGSDVNIRWTDEQKKQVSQLIFDCGLSVEMDYTYSEGSAASSDNVPGAIKSHFSYSENATGLYRSAYTLDRWFSIIKNEIDNDRIVYYSGVGSVGGHAFVCDGYDTEGQKLHINWGWGGDYNAYYTLDLEVDDSDFSTYQMAVIGFAPNTSVVEHGEEPQLLHYPLDDCPGIKPTTSMDIVQGSQISFGVGYFLNSTDKSVSKEFKVCLIDGNDGSIRQEGWTLSKDFPAADGMAYADVTTKTVLNVAPKLNDYFKLYVKEGEKWIPFNHNHDVFPDGDGLCCGITQDPVIILPETCSVGQEIELKLSYGFQPVVSKKWSVNGNSYTGSKLTLGSGKTELKVEVEYFDGSTGTITATVKAE